ncbi:trypsin [Nitzschia inconspicua]|uniref:Trypsin n=1 Tax=Nitzschia inconspicua TaxID=303405 RepID=A0A9K3PHP1_9STRA|nr:trypsin [Nitzschia inconspicua]
MKSSIVRLVSLLWLPKYIATALPSNSSALSVENDESFHRSMSDTPPSLQSGVNVPQNRIVQGYRSDPYQRRFFAKAGNDNYPETSEIVCGATLITRDIALSAAHCQGAFNYGLLVLNPDSGNYDLPVPVSRQIRHPGWDQDRNNLNYDVLVLKLQTPLAVDDVAQPIPFNTDPNYPVDGQLVMALGFGVTESNSLPAYLKEAEFEYITNEKCFGRTIQFNNVLNSDEIMCTDPVEGSSTCLGDSGGPLTNIDGTRLLGIVSFGSGCRANQIPDGYARTSAMSDWIQQQICELSEFPPANCPSQARNGVDVKMRLHFQHDFWSDETTFAVRERSTRSILHAGPQYTPKRGADEVEDFFLPSGEYTFEVWDTDGSGLLSKGRGRDGSWYLTALYDGSTETRVAEGGADFGQVQYTDFTVVGSPLNESPPLNVALETCLFEKSEEEIAGRLVGTFCQCSDSGGITCRNGAGRVCQRKNQACTLTADCCGGRTCRGGICRSQGADTDRNDNRLGGIFVSGGAAGRQREGNLLRGRQ